MGFGLSLCVFTGLPSVAHGSGISSNAGTASSAFLKIGSGARPAAMGGAFAGVADDVNALYWNPAGIARLQNREMTFSHNIWLEDTSYEYLGVVQPLDNYVMGAGVSYFNIGTMDGWDVNNAPTGNFSARSIAFALSVGRVMNDKLSLGLTLKTVHEKIETESASAFAADAGGMYKLGDDSSIAFVVQNLGTGVKFVKESAGLPVNIKIGGAHRLLQNNLILSLDFNKYSDTGFRGDFGAEYRLAETLALRLGYNSGNDMGSGLTAGFGFRISSLNVDYAFVPYGDLGNAHRFSLSYNFNVNAPQQPRVVEVRVKQAVKADMEPIKPPAPQAVKAGVKPTRTGAGNNRK